MDRFTKTVVAGVIALVVLGVAVVALVSGRTEPPDLSTPRGTVLAYLQAVRRAEPDRAYDLLAASLQRQVTLAQFSQQAGYLGDDRRRVDVGDAVVDGDRARVPVNYRYESGLFGSYSTSQQTALLARENGQWRLTSVPEPFLPPLREP